jgi:ferritin-like metal-binding protein YciE
MKINSLKSLYAEQLKDLYSAEHQLVAALPRFEAAAYDDDVKAAFASHLDETRGHVDRIEKVCQKQGFAPEGHRCKGMEGLITEATDTFAEIEDPAVRDAALISLVQRIEHYEMAGYGSARTFAEKLGDHESAEILQRTLDEEGNADRVLSRLAERSINTRAMQV